ncbi:MAG: carbamoyltransferase [Chloroflexi bacterium]|nr:carbamoyltransferase [Chloroflexota bacterium]
MHILGISCFYHDAAACLLRDGELVAAAEEERFTRRKHDSGFPARAVRYCLQAGGITADDLDYVVFYEKPLLKFERILSSYAATFPRSRRAFVRAMQTWLGEKLWLRGHIRKQLAYDGPILFGEHHVSHAASAYFPSPFDHAAIVTADGVGEWCSTTLGVANGLDLELTHELRFPHSLGLLYSAFTAYLGFEVNEGEYKVMGMAAYGRPRYVDQVRRLLQLADDGSFHLDMRYLAYHHSLHSFSRAFVELFGPPRSPDAGLEERCADIAASIQVVTEEAMLGLARQARALSGSQNLCMAGGVALNVLANARVLREAGFDNLWVQPAAGDSGGCVGAATYLYHTVLRGERRYRMETAYLGPGYSNEEIHAFLHELDVPFTVLADAEIAPVVARLLAEGNIVGWFQGRMEFGPRALGARSILADPTDPGMKDKLNEKIKHREQFRPFAPAVLREAASTYFDFDGRTLERESPFMLLVARVDPAKRHLVPAITHADGTARVQTVGREQHPLFYDLIQAFGQLTGVPVLVNTSFNVRGEPIVCTPAEAFNCFSHTDLDYLVMGNALVPASSKRQIRAYPGAKQVYAEQVGVV